MSKKSTPKSVVPPTHQRKLRSIAFYNPHLLAKQELVDLFSARGYLLDHLLADLSATRPHQIPQHHLMIGQRGMGKTTLLARLRYAVEDDADLSREWLALAFPEELYGVARLSDFWQSCIDTLLEALDRSGFPREAQALRAWQREPHKLEEDDRARETLAMLVDTAKGMGRRLILLVDNADLLLERLKTQAWTLREALSSESFIAFVGASANTIESVWTYEEAFYDFFHVHELMGLTLEETRNLLLRFAEVWCDKDVTRIVNEEPSRIAALHTLTGGNPRTIALLFSVLSQGVDGDVRTDLERLLDQSTPLYKAQIEALAPQAQQIVHALAIHWNPVSAAELATQIHMDINAISSQLSRLTSQGVVEKVAYEPSTKTGFQLAERFFNIWYLMRTSGLARLRLTWLVEFLRLFYSQEQLRAYDRLHRQMAQALDDPAERARHAEFSLAVARSVAEKNQHDPVVRESKADWIEASDLEALRGGPDQAAAFQRIFQKSLRWVDWFKGDLSADDLVEVVSQAFSEELEAILSPTESPAAVSGRLKKALNRNRARQKRWYLHHSRLSFADVDWMIDSGLPHPPHWESLLEDIERGFDEKDWPRILAFFRTAIQMGNARLGVKLLAQLELADRWRPLYEAMEAFARGKRSYLRRIAPEVRGAAEEIFDLLLPAGIPAGPQEPQSVKVSRTRSRKPRRVAPRIE